MQPLAKVVLRGMNISSVHEPVKDLKDATFKSNKGKIEAGKTPDAHHFVVCLLARTRHRRHLAAEEDPQDPEGVDHGASESAQQPGEGAEQQDHDGRYRCDEQCVADVALVPAPLENHLPVAESGSHICADQIVSV